MNTTLDSRLAFWLLGLCALGVYMFQFAPIVVVMLLSFNSSRSGAFPMEGLSLQWYHKLFANDSILEAFQTSVILAFGSSLIATVLGVMAAIALVRYSFKGKNAISTLISLPLLVPEVVLGVALLIFLKYMGIYRSFGMLMLGHTVLALPFVVLVVQARLVGLRQNFEEAALSLGANRLQTFREVTLPLISPAILGGFLFAVAISFDNITATLFWKKPGIETVPSKIFAMLRTSVSPEINALGTVMIVLTILLPLIGGYAVRRLSRGR
ncbi:MAG: ABC transporter permease [Rhodospirillaceae bacterium]|jgi:spermidine/putrescine transport system permease protein|nr:ABC transporter permease [Rhodospirillaceae bacterium]